MVGDFGEGRDGRTRVGISLSALGDGDDRGESFDEIDVGTIDRFKEAAGFGGKGFQVLARALGM